MRAWDMSTFVTVIVQFQWRRRRMPEMPPRKTQLVRKACAKPCCNAEDMSSCEFMSDPTNTVLSSKRKYDHSDFSHETAPQGRGRINLTPGSKLARRFPQHVKMGVNAAIINVTISFFPPSRENSCGPCMAVFSCACTQKTDGGVFGAQRCGGGGVALSHHPYRPRRKS